MSDPVTLTIDAGTPEWIDFEGELMARIPVLVDGKEIGDIMLTCEDWDD